jgi:lipoprotein NlpI
MVPVPSQLVLLALLQAQPADWREYQQRGENSFRQGNIEASIRDFDKAIELEPRLAPHNWQRGIALYYAGRHADCARQFESHRIVNPEDVENAVWHFLCVARSKDLEAARRGLIEIHRDDRVPMMEVYALFRGSSTPKKVLAVAGNNRSGLFYAHLYVGLYYEARGDAKGALTHIRKAATDYSADHYMGDVARVHLKRAKP